MKDSAICERCE